MWCSHVRAWGRRRHLHPCKARRDPGREWLGLAGRWNSRPRRWYKNKNLAGNRVRLSVRNTTWPSLHYFLLKYLVKH